MNTFGKRSSHSPCMETASVISQGKASNINSRVNAIASKYAARLLYSQVDLGSDDDDVRSTKSFKSRGGSVVHSR